MREVAGGVTFTVKVVPGAARDQVIGPLGEAWKVQVACPPEQGKANSRLCEVLAAALAVPTRAVQVVSGHQNPRKVVAVQGLGSDDANQRLVAASRRPTAR